MTCIGRTIRSVAVSARQIADIRVDQRREEVEQGARNRVRSELTEEQQKLQEAAIAFARGVAGAATWSRATARRTSTATPGARCAEFGVLGMPIPQEYGGLGLGLSELLAVMEGLGTRHARSGPAVLAERAPVDQLDSDPAVRHGGAAQQVPAGLCDGTLSARTPRPSPTPAPTSSACGRARRATATTTS